MVPVTPSGSWTRPIWRSCAGSSGGQYAMLMLIGDGAKTGGWSSRNCIDDIYGKTGLMWRLTGSLREVQSTGLQWQVYLLHEKNTREEGQSCSILSSSYNSSFRADHAGQLSSGDVHGTWQWSTVDFNRVDDCLIFHSTCARQPYQLRSHVELDVRT